MLIAPTRRGVLRAVMGAAVPLADRGFVPRLTVSANRMLTCGTMRMACVVGRTGIRVDKREGDGATPAGGFSLRRVLFRPDRVAHVQSGLPVTPIARTDGWCTEPDDPLYNQQIRLPYAGAHEELWRRDTLYDVIVVIGHNDAPAIPMHGSAIFLHVSRPGMTGTDGCVAIPLPALLDVLRQCGPETTIEISA